MTDDSPPRTCDFCSSARAVLYCAADSAKLCLSCDREVHSTNQLFTKHTRSLLCDACDSSSSTILCSSESLSLCHNCDFDSHRHSHSSPHDRRPLEGFSGCPSVDDLATWLGFEGVDLKGKGLVCGDDDLGFGDFDGDCLDLLVWDTPTIVSIDDLIASNGSDRRFQAMGVPPLPKNRKAACGKYKEEILSQLREMSKSEPSLIDGHEDVKPITEFQFSGHQQDLYPADMYSGFGNTVESPKLPRFKGGSVWCNDNVDFANESLPSKILGSSFDDSLLVPNKDSDTNDDASLVKNFLVPDKYSNYGHDEQPIHNIKTESPQALPKFIPRELTSQERDYAISRYKEKKRTRRFDKHVRYESRKIRAESRTRIKGRFAKIDHHGTGMQ